MTRTKEKKVGGTTDEQRRELIQSRVTLDGRPASISGRQQQFATVAAIDGTYLAVEFCWSTVARIVARDGQFHT